MQAAAGRRPRAGGGMRLSDFARPALPPSMSIAPTPEQADAAAAAAGGGGRAPARVSDLLWSLVETWPQPRISLGDLVAALGDRGYAILMLVFALPNLSPVTIPGLSAVFGLPLAGIALQMALGRPRPWLPRWLLRRAIARADFARLVNPCLPRLRRIEALMRPRWSDLASRPAEPFLGVVCLLLALLLSLPIPFTNVAIAVPLCLIALGILERDGLWVIAGLAASLTAGGLAIWFGWALIEEAVLLLHGSLSF